MKNHTKIYLQALDYRPGEFIPSELSGQKAVDIHHIISRGRGGKDRIENLMALTREEHLKYGDKKEWMYFLLVKHLGFLHRKGVECSNDWFNDQLKKYEDCN